MKVFVTGSTGFVGREVIRRLHKPGHQSIRLVRKRPPGGQPQDELRVGDILEPQSLREAVRGADAVIHLVGIISQVGQVTFENIHVRGTMNVVTAARECGIRRFIHMSALGTRANARSAYHQTKWAAEEAVRQSGLDYTIFRPSLIYGPEDHFVNMFAKMIRRSPGVPVIGSGRALLQPVAVDCVAEAFVRALSEPDASGKTFDLCGPERMTLPELLDRVLGVMGRRRLKLRIPLPIARFQARLLEAVYPAVLGKAPPLNRDQVMMLEEDVVGDPQPADTLFKLRHLAFSEGIRYVADSGGERGTVRA